MFIQCCCFFNSDTKRLNKQKVYKSSLLLSRWIRCVRGRSPFHWFKKKKEKKKKDFSFGPVLRHLYQVPVTSIMFLLAGCRSAALWNWSGVGTSPRRDQMFPLRQTWRPMCSICSGQTSVPIWIFFHLQRSFFFPPTREHDNTRQLDIWDVSKIRFRYSSM